MPQPQTTKEKTEAALRLVPVAGRPISPRGKATCIVCRRALGAMGRLLYPSAPTCMEAACETTRASDVTEIFSTNYGRAVDLYTLRTFLRCLDGPSVYVDRTALVGRAAELADAFAVLERWQWAFSSWTLVHRPEGLELGRAVLIPPRRIDEVVRIRLKGAWLTVDPSEGLSEPMRTEVRDIHVGGPKVEEVPF